MNRKEKEVTINRLREDFVASDTSFLVNYKGMSVVQMQALRKQLRESGAKIKVAKDRLIKIAVEENKSAKELIPFLKDQIAIVFANQNAGTVAKVVSEFADNSSLDIVVGIVDTDFFDKAKIKRLASLPSREVLLAQLCGALKANIAKVAIALNILSEKRAESTKKPQEEIKPETAVADTAKAQASEESAKEIVNTEKKEPEKFENIQKDAAQESNQKKPELSEEPSKEPTSDVSSENKDKKTEE